MTSLVIMDQALVIVLSGDMVLTIVLKGSDMGLVVPGVVAEDHLTGAAEDTVH